jgi:hypothetical protein
VATVAQVRPPPADPANNAFLTAMTHIAIQESVGGKNVDWMEKVRDEQYRK